MPIGLQYLLNVALVESTLMVLGAYHCLPSLHSPTQAATRTSMAVVEYSTFGKLYASVCFSAAYLQQAGGVSSMAFKHSEEGS